MDKKAIQKRPRGRPALLEKRLLAKAAWAANPACHRANTAKALGVGRSTLLGWFAQFPHEDPLTDDEWRRAMRARAGVYVERLVAVSLEKLGELTGEQAGRLAAKYFELLGVVPRDAEAALMNVNVTVEAGPPVDAAEAEWGFADPALAGKTEVRA